MAKHPHRDQEKRRSDEVLASVVEATVQVTAQHLASPWLRDLLAQKFQWHTLFTRTIEAASSLASRNISPDLFNSYLILGSRWFSHHEAVETLLSTGRYGDCMMLLRSLLEDTDLMTYFACYPEEVADWRERLSRAPFWSDEIYRKGIRKYRMPQVWKMLKAKGIEPGCGARLPDPECHGPCLTLGRLLLWSHLAWRTQTVSISAWHRSTTRLPPSQQASFSRGHIHDPFTRFL